MKKLIIILFMIISNFCVSQICNSGYYYKYEGLCVKRYEKRFIGFDKNIPIFEKIYKETIWKQQYNIGYVYVWDSEKKEWIKEWYDGDVWYFIWSEWKIY